MVETRTDLPYGKLVKQENCGQLEGQMDFTFRYVVN